MGVNLIVAEFVPADAIGTYKSWKGQGVQNQCFSIKCFE
jgi:hypothetical protein